MLISVDAASERTPHQATVVVMSQGRIHQAASPMEVYRQPADAFVADFIGLTNLLDGQVTQPGMVQVPGGALSLPGLPPSGRVLLSIRPEEVIVHPVSTDGPNRLPGTLSFMRDLGSSVEFRIDVAGKEIIALSRPQDRPPVEPGGALSVELPPGSCVVLPPMGAS